MSNATKFLLLAFGLMLTCLLVVYSNMVFKTGLETSNTVMGKLDEFSKALAESDVTMYDGYEVCGSDVVNFIKKHLGSYDATEKAIVYVRVDTTVSSMTYQNGASIPEIQDFSSSLYIKPVARFVCSVKRDENDVIIGINFAQR